MADVKLPHSSDEHGLLDTSQAKHQTHLRKIFKLFLSIMFRRNLLHDCYVGYRIAPAEVLSPSMAYGVLH